VTAGESGCCSAIPETTSMTDVMGLNRAPAGVGIAGDLPRGSHNAIATANVRPVRPATLSFAYGHRASDSLLSSSRDWQRACHPRLSLWDSRLWGGACCGDGSACAGIPRSENATAPSAQVKNNLSVGCRRVSWVVAVVPGRLRIRVHFVAESAPTRNKRGQHSYFLSSRE
jgi:hypothetical protein